MNTDLLFENARLQGRIITLEAEVKCLEAVIRSHERVDCLSVTSLKKQLVEADAENARLKAECQARQAENSVLAVECDSLKAEVADLKSTADRFKAEVERLRKLGTEMGKHLPDTDEANRAYIDFEAGGKS